MFASSVFKIKKYRIVKILAREMSHERARGKNIFHFRYVFNLNRNLFFDISDVSRKLVR